MNTSNVVRFGSTVPVTVEQMCMMWLKRLMSISCTTSTLLGRQTLLKSLRDRSTSMMCSLRSFGSASNSLARRSSSSGVAPRGREPAIGKVIACPLSTLISVSGLEPITLKSRPSASVSVMKYMYGLGLSVRSTRYTSNGSAGESRSRRWDITVWNTSPSTMCRFVSSTQRSYSALAVRNRSWGWGRLRSSTLTRASPATGVAALRCMASSRSMASSYAASARVGRSSTFTALAISHTEPDTWSTTAMSVAKASVTSGWPVSSGAAARSLGSQWRMASQPTEPTSPLVRFGSPATCGALSTLSAAWATSITSPSVGTPAGTWPSQFALP